MANVLLLDSNCNSNADSNSNSDCNAAVNTTSPVRVSPAAAATATLFDHGEIDHPTARAEAAVDSLTTSTNTNVNVNTKANPHLLHRNGSGSGSGGVGETADNWTSVQVAVRLRPTLDSDEEDCMRIIPSSSSSSSSSISSRNLNHTRRNDNKNNHNHKNTLQMGGPHGPLFTFDHVLGKRTRQSEVYQRVVAPLVHNCLQGYNATIFAYGQTGSGKTYTMMGDHHPHPHHNLRLNVQGETLLGDQCQEDEFSSSSSSTAGVIPRAMKDLFQRLNDRQHSEQDTAATAAASSSFSFVIKLQFLELYGEEIRDLLQSSSTSTSQTLHHNHHTHNTHSHYHHPQHNKLTIRELTNGEPEVVGATQRIVQSPEEALLALTHGMVRRVTGATHMNTTSSRSHAILTLFLEQHWETATHDHHDDDEQQEVARVQTSKFHFVDLAGSERQKRTGASGKRLKEGIDINKGLLVLGNVISSLADKNASFVPYRDSKLTRLLSGSLGGNHKTLMIACVSPSSINFEESLNCLRYANRAKNITNKAVVNCTSHINLEKVVDRLRMQLSTVAQALLDAVNAGYPIHDNENEQESHAASSSVHTLLSLSSLQALASGQMIESSSSSSSSLPNALLSSSSSLSPSLLPSTLPPVPDTNNNDPDGDGGGGGGGWWLLERELARVRSEWLATRQFQEMAERDLYQAQAHNQILLLKLHSHSTGPNNHHHNHENGMASDEVAATTLEMRFAQRAARYEEEIGQLRRGLEQAQREAAAARLDWTTTTTDAEEDTAVIRRLTNGVEADRRRLDRLRAHWNIETTEQENVAVVEIDHDTTATSPRTRYDREEQSEEAHIQNLTKKYVPEEDEDFPDDENSDEYDVHCAEAKTNDNKASSIESIAETSARCIKADLIELDRNITAKEDLIGQLLLSQEKYATMRDFYEDRLHKMAVTLSEKEMERESLLQEIERSKEVDNDDNKHELKRRLQEKEMELTTLRKNQKELQGLTRVSSKNNFEIQRLREEVLSMKRRKVEMQNQLGQERKHHAMEKKLLEKTMIQKEREASKWHKQAVQHEDQANRANQVAKVRLEELGQLRTKYKDAEKKLRIISLKRGVMEKAGLNHVMVGRRSRETVHKDYPPSISRKPPDVDSLRDVFDQKVADVVRKEAIADKLANEWEEHFELTTKKKILLETNDDGSDDAVQSLSIQIQFKEDRIRHLAQRLGKRVEQPDVGSIGTSLKEHSFLFDESCERLCADCSIQEKLNLSTTVLFGMVVRERRRVAALARAASALDERSQASEKAAQTNEAALRSYMSEQRRELAAIKQSQQEQILSLMDLVKQDGATRNVSPNDSEQSSDELVVADHRLLVLARERIAVLERQVDDLRADSQAAESYREDVNDLSNNVKLISEEKEALQHEISGLRSVLRQIREQLVHTSNESGHAEPTILEIINDTLHPRSKSPSTAKSRSASQSVRESRSASSFQCNSISPRMKKHVELMHSSDSEEDGESPDWAAEIMKDLALIAEGKVPPSLQGSAYMPIPTAGDDDGIPLSPESNSRTKSSPLPTPNSTRSRISRGSDRIALSKEISARLDQIAITSGSSPHRIGISSRDGVSDERTNSFSSIPSTTFPTVTVTPPLEKNIASVPISSSSAVTSRPPPSTDLSHKTVFERLISPSHYTGTQKDRFQSQQQSLQQQQQQSTKKAPKDSTPQLLDDLLHNSNVESSSTAQSLVVVPPMPLVGNSSNHTRRRRKDLHHSLPVSEYSEQNVFERLTKTTTQAFAIKQQSLHSVSSNHYQNQKSSNKPTSAAPVSTSSSSASSPSPSSSSSRGDDDLACDNLLDELLRSDSDVADMEGDVTEEESSTQQQKHHHRHHRGGSISNTGSFIDSATSSSTTIPTTTSSRLGEYIQQDVFERLQRTTTQAYAVKHLDSNMTVHHYNNNASFNTSTSAFSSSSNHHQSDNEKEFSSYSGSPYPLATRSIVNSSSHPNSNDHPLFAHTAAGSGAASPTAEKPTFPAPPLLHSLSINPPTSYYQQHPPRPDVFERLQTTTTEAFANKTVPARNSWDDPYHHQ